MAVLLFTLGLAGCDGAASPSAPSRVPEPTPEPPSSQRPYTLTASSSTVAPGGQLSVSWNAPTGGTRDWIGLFSLGAPPCDHGWAELTRGTTSGTLTLSAPSKPGEYEFRYHRGDTCDESARSSPVTVSQGS